MGVVADRVGIAGFGAFLGWVASLWLQTYQQRLEQSKVDLGFVRFFYWEITNNDARRSENALKLLETLHPALRAKLLPLAATQHPASVQAEAQRLAYDPTLDAQTRGLAERLRRDISEKLAITVPKDGNTVGPKESIEGSTPYPADYNHFIVVRDEKTGTAFLQDEPVSVNNGHLEGGAMFGSADVGEGQMFRLYVLVTRASREEVRERLPNHPADVHTSIEIAVTRRAAGNGR